MVYYVFYCMSYRVENKLNKMVKVANQTLIFTHTIFLICVLFNHADSKQNEFGYLTIFVVITLFVLNVIVTLNPIQREDNIDVHNRGCCSSNNIMPTISFIFCF